MNKKGSLFHISKRDALPLPKALLIRGGILLLALVFCGLITTLLTGQDPIAVYGTILKGAFGTSRKIWVTGQNVAVLLGISLAVTPAFKMRFWNIGAEGQTLIGCLATTTCMILLGGKVSNFLLIVISLAAALLAGAVWGFLPAFFKARWNTNETLFTLMMNYIAMQLASYFIIIWEVPKGAGKIGIINQASEAGWLPRIGGQAQLLPILVVALLTGMMYIYLTYSHHHRGQPRLYRRHGVLDVQVQPLHHDRRLPAAGDHGSRCRRDLHRLQPEPVLRGYSDRYHSVLHHCYRVLHHLQGHSAQEQQKGGVTDGLRLCILLPPRGHAGYPPAVRQHRRDPHGEVR